MSENQEELMRAIKENNKAGIIVMGDDHASLRDWFAINATEEDIKRNHEYAPEDIQRLRDILEVWNGRCPLPSMKEITTREEARYNYADKMLAARNKNVG